MKYKTKSPAKNPQNNQISITSVPARFLIMMMFYHSNKHKMDHLWSLEYETSVQFTKSSITPQRNKNGPFLKLEYETSVQFTQIIITPHRNKMDHL